MRIALLCRMATLVLLVSAPASAQDASTSAACAGLAPDSVEAAILDCFEPTNPPAPVLHDREPVDEPFSNAAPEPVPEALAAPLPTPTPAPIGDAAIADPEPPASPPARNEALVQVFADWLERHPIGSRLDPAEARLLEGADVPASLPLLPLGRSYAEVDGMIVELDLETGELLRLVRRAPVLAEVPQSPVMVRDVAPDVSQADDEERRLEEAARAQVELEVVERAREEREEEVAERELREEAVRKAAALAEEELARELAERELEERVQRAEEAAREATARAEAERERAEELARELVEQEREEELAREAAEIELAEELAREAAEREYVEELARELAESEREEGREVDQVRRGDAQALDIPNGHLPPPGSCRVWYPDRPPGHQPPPTSCSVEVPPGAVLIRG